MIRKCLYVLASMSVLLSFGCYGQTQRVLRDTGLYKLSTFIGTWRAFNEPLPGEKNPQAFSSEYTCTWSPGKNFIICDQFVETPHGKINNLAIYSFDARTGNYKLSLVGIPGMEPFSLPVLAKNDTLFYNSESTNKGRKTYYRTINVFTSDETYDYFVQSSSDMHIWTTSMKGKATKK